MHLEPRSSSSLRRRDVLSLQLPISRLCSSGKKNKTPDLLQLSFTLELFFWCFLCSAASSGSARSSRGDRGPQRCVGFNVAWSVRLCWWAWLRRRDGDVREGVTDSKSEMGEERELMRKRAGVRGNGLERKIQSCQEAVTDAAVGEAEEWTAGQRAGVSRNAPHSNAGLNLAGEDEQSWWLNMEKLSPSLGSPPSEPCELLEASPGTTPLQLRPFLQTGDGVDPSDHMQLREHPSSCFVNTDFSSPFPSRCGQNALKCAPVVGVSSLAFREDGWWRTGDTSLTDRHQRVKNSDTL